MKNAETKLDFRCALVWSAVPQHMQTKPAMPTVAGQKKSFHKRLPIAPEAGSGMKVCVEYNATEVWYGANGLLSW